MADDQVSQEGQKYELDEDGFRREIVGPWARDKYLRLQKYVGISRAVRRKFLGAGKAGATYLDPFSGPGRVRIRNESSGTEGSPLVAWNEASKTGTGFTQFHVADADPENSKAVRERLQKIGAPVHSETGPATQTLLSIIPRLDRDALHFAFLDPYKLGHLSFEIIKQLAQFKRMDILMHVSSQDLQRNLRRYIDQENSPLDAFAPGWRNIVDCNRQDHLVRAKLLEYWRGLLRQLGMDTAEVAERVIGSKRQPLYWLAFVARNELALEFWEKIRDVDGSSQLKLL